MRPGRHRAAAGDREHVLDRQQERLVDRPVRGRDILVHRRHQLAHRLLADLRVAVLERRQRRAGDDRDIVAGEVVGGQELAHLELDQLEELRVVDLVDLVQKHHHRRHADLLGQEDVLAGLRHRAVGGGDHQDRAVHLRRAGDHVLHVVGVAGAVDVGIVPRRRLIFHVRGRDGDAAGLLLGSGVDLVVGLVLAEILGDRRRQRRLAVIDMPDRADVHMRLRALKLCLRHLALPALGPRPPVCDARRDSSNPVKTQAAKSLRRPPGTC